MGQSWFLVGKGRVCAENRAPPTRRHAKCHVGQRDQGRGRATSHSRHGGAARDAAAEHAGASVANTQRGVIYQHLVAVTEDEAAGARQQWRCKRQRRCKRGMFPLAVVFAHSSCPPPGGCQLFRFLRVFFGALFAGGRAASRGCTPAATLAGLRSESRNVGGVHADAGALRDAEP